MKNFTGLLAIIIFLGLHSCGDRQEETRALNDKIQIVATTGMIADMAANVGGDKVDVTGLMGPGVDPHLYKHDAPV